jgi:hypothetical protein
MRFNRFNCGRLIIKRESTQTSGLTEQNINSIRENFLKIYSDEIQKKFACSEFCKNFVITLFLAYGNFSD